MCKLVVFVCISLAFQGTSADVQPRDLVDEAQEQLAQLKSLVQGDIAAAHINLRALTSTFGNYINSVVKFGVLEVQQGHGTIMSEISTLKQLAGSAGKDVTSCTDTSEDLLNRLPNDYINTMSNCGIALLDEGRSILKDVEYFIDININKVLSLENQLLRCGDSIICIAPIVTEIQLDKVRLPASIKTEVNAFDSQLSTVKLSAHQCSDPQVASYVSQANSVLADITACINKILGKL